VSFAPQCHEEIDEKNAAGQHSRGKDQQTNHAPLHEKQFAAISILISTGQA
jgi:hypothetical protein